MSVKTLDVHSFARDVGRNLYLDIQARPVSLS
jgi:hypothetical protein